MKLALDVDGDIEKIMADEVLMGKIAVTSAMSQAGSELKSIWRGQVQQAGLGNRLANSIRSNVYPSGRPSLNAAALVYTNADEIILAHETGPLIRSTDGFWLAVPLPSAGKSARGGRISPAEWEARTGRRLRFVYRAGRSALLVDDGTVKAGARTMGRDGFSRAARGFKNRTVPIFALVPQVKLQKRLSLMVAADAYAGRVPGNAVARWK
jgi:hypothetical protein